MSKGSVELVYRANDAFQRRDLEAFLALIDADAEVAPRGPTVARIEATRV